MAEVVPARSVYGEFWISGLSLVPGVEFHVSGPAPKESKDHTCAGNVSDRRGAAREQCSSRDPKRMPLYIAKMATCKRPQVEALCELPLRRRRHCDSPASTATQLPGARTAVPGESQLPVSGIMIPKMQG